MTESNVYAKQNNCNWYQSVNAEVASVFFNNESITNGIAHQSNNTDYGVKAFNNDTEEVVHTIIAIDTASGTSYLKKGEEEWTVLENLSGIGMKGDFPNEETAWYAGFAVNSGVENVHVENLRCYDVEGNDLGVTTTLNEIIVCDENGDIVVEGEDNFNGNIIVKKKDDGIKILIIVAIVVVLVFITTILFKKRRK